MKYILKMLWFTLVMIIGGIVFGIKAIWTFKTNDLKDLWSEYRNGIARCTWNAFKINIY